MGYREKSLLSFYTPFAIWYKCNYVTHKHVKLDYDAQSGNSHTNPGRRKDDTLIHLAAGKAILFAPVLCYRASCLVYTSASVPQEQTALCRNIFRQILKSVTFTEVLPGNDHLGHETQGQEKMSNSKMSASSMVLTTPLNFVKMLLYTSWSLGPWSFRMDISFSKLLVKRKHNTILTVTQLATLYLSWYSTSTMSCCC